MRALALTLSLLVTPALAQQPVTMVHASPPPWHSGGNIRDEWVRMQREFPPGSCAVGTFQSADVQVLKIPGIRVKPDAEFWPHNGFSVTAFGAPSNPWVIAPGSAIEMYGGLPAKLRDDMLSRLGATSNYVVFYTGADLIARFGYRSCGGR
jgi:hypothetical protein